MSLKETWEKIEDKWYSFLDSLDAKGIPVYKIINPIEKIGIPSLPLFIAIILVLLGGIAFIAAPPAVHGGSITVAVRANGKALEGASIAVSLDNQVIGSWETGKSGNAKISLPKTGMLKLTITKENCETINKTLQFSGGNIQLALSTQCAGGNETNPQGCLPIPPKIGAAPILNQNGEPVKNCKAYLVDQNGTSKELDWNFTDDGYLLVTSTDCLTQNDRIRIECAGYSGEFYADEFLDYAESGEPIYLAPGSSEFSGDSNNDGIPDYTQGNGNGWGTGTTGLDQWNVTWGTNNTTWSGSSWDVDDNGNGVPDSYEADNQEEQENYMALTVTVVDKETRQKLSGVEVTAVDSNGTRLPGNETTGVTEDGIVVLHVPRQRLSLQTIDPSGNYSSLTTPPFYPTGYTTLALTKGWPSVIWVKSEDGSGIGGATVIVNKVKLFTDYQGKAVISLPKQVYDVYAYKDGYRPATGSIVGGENTTVNLELLTDNNSGPLTLEILNPARAGDPYPDVQVKLVSGDGLAGECETPSNGRCSWDRIYATTYQVMAKPPLAYDYDNIGTIEINPGRDNFYSLEVYPPKTDLRVRTLVEGKPENDVKVTLYSTYPDIEKVDEQRSKESYATFKAYTGTTYYISATWKNKTTILYGSYGPFELKNREDIQINLEKPETQISFSIDKTLRKGSRTTGDLKLELPYLDERKKIKYDKVILEIWTGDPGNKFDPAQTPILIDKVPKLVRLSEVSQIPKIGLLGFSSYQSRLTGSTRPAVETSKGLRITIEKYKPGIMDIKLPILARLGALADTTTIHYHAIYSSKQQTYDTGWNEETVKITGKSDWNNIPGGDFYLFKAGLTLDPNSKNWEKEITGTVGSNVYLHIIAISRAYSKHGRIDLSIDPNIADPIEFWGEITNKTNTWKIEKSKAGAIFDVMTSAMKNSLEPEDQVEITVSINLKENGTISVIPFANEYKDEGRPLALKIKAINVSWTPTPIPDVEGAITPQVHFTMDDLPPGYLGNDYWGTFKNTSMPVFSLVSGIPREFRIPIALKNSAHQSFKLNLDAEAESNGQPIDLGLDYDKETSLGQGTKTIEILGVGPDEPTSGTISIWIWQNGEDRPSEPWAQVNFEANDFLITIISNNTFTSESGKISTKKLIDQVSEFTSSGEIDVENGNKVPQIPSSASFGDSAAKKVYINNSPTFIFTTGNLEPGQTVPVSAKSVEFSLERGYKVQGAPISPEPGTLPPSKLDESKPSWTGTIKATNWWNSTLTVKPKLWSDYIHERSATISGFKSKEYNNYNIILTGTVYSGNQPIPPLNRTGSSIKLEPGQTVVITWKVTSLGSITNQYPMNMKLELGLKASGIEKIANFYKNITSNFQTPQGPGQVSGNFTPGNYTVMREFTDLTGIDYQTSCLAEMGNELKSARVCDAKQMLKVINSMVEALSKSHENYIIGGPYAMGNDFLTLTDIKKSVSEMADLKVNGNPGQISCGVVKMEITRDNQGYHLITILNQGMPWCNPGFPSYMLGLMNPDYGLSSPSTMPYAFEEGSDDFKKYLDELMSGNSKEITGYKDIITKPPTGKNNWYTIRWLNISSSDLGNYPYLSWIDMGDSNVVGFMKWFPESTGVYTRQSNSLIFGIAHKPNIPGSTLGKLAKCFVANLIYQQITGNSTFENSLNASKGTTVSLDTCKMPDMNNVISIPSYDFEIYDMQNDIITEKWTNSNIIYIKVTNDSEVPLAYCYVGADDDDFMSSGYEHEWSESKEGVEIQGLDEDGEHTVKVVCVSKSGIMGPVITKTVKIDRTPPTITGTNFVGLSLGLSQCTKTEIFTVNDSGSGLKKCWFVPGVKSSDGSVIPKESSKSYECSSGETVFGSTKVTCDVGTNDWADDINDWVPVANPQNCYLLPLDLYAVVECSDNVGNVGKFPVEVVLSGSTVSVEPINNDTCPILTSDTIVSGDCLFSPAAREETTYYTNIEGSTKMCFRIKAAVPEVSCALTITSEGGGAPEIEQTLSKVSGDIHSSSGAEYCTDVDIGSLDEGDYTVDVTCSGGQGEEGNEYTYVGADCSGENAWTSRTCQASLSTGNSEEAGTPT